MLKKSKKQEVKLYSESAYPYLLGEARESHSPVAGCLKIWGLYSLVSICQVNVFSNLRRRLEGKRMGAFSSFLQCAISELVICMKQSVLSQ